MSVRPENLDHQERHMNLTTRDVVKDRKPNEPGDQSAQELIDLMARIVAAKLMKPLVGTHCADCFQKGRDAAIRAIEGEGQ